MYYMYIWIILKYDKLFLFPYRFFCPIEESKSRGLGPHAPKWHFSPWCEALASVSKHWKHWYVWIMIGIMSLDMDNFLDMDSDMDKHKYNMRGFSSSTRWFRYDFGEAGEPFAARRGEAQLIFAETAGVTRLATDPGNAGWDQASRPWQLSWYLLAAAVWAAQLCYVKWCGMVLVWLHNMVKTCQNHYYHTARSDYGVRLRIREGFVHRDKTIVGLACASSFWNRDFKTIARSSSMKNKWPKKRLIWYMDRNFEQKPSSWPRGLPNTSQLGGCLYGCWGLDEEWTCLGCIRIYIYTDILHVRIHHKILSCVVYIYTYLQYIYIYGHPLPDPPPKNLICQLFAKKKSLTMHLIWRISPHNAFDLQSIFSTSAEPNRRIAELFLG